MLAGISTAYLQRLEQGRDRHPSPEVLDSLASAMRMDVKARAYLTELRKPDAARLESSAARPLPRTSPRSSRHGDTRRHPEQVSGRAGRQHHRHGSLAGFAVGVNTCRWRFTDPAAHEVYGNWEEATAIAVGGLRELSAVEAGDPRLAEMVDELSAASPDSASCGIRSRWDTARVSAAFATPRWGTYNSAEASSTSRTRRDNTCCCSTPTREAQSATRWSGCARSSSPVARRFPTSTRRTWRGSCFQRSIRPAAPACPRVWAAGLTTAAPRASTDRLDMGNSSHGL